MKAIPPSSSGRRATRPDREALGWPAPARVQLADDQMPADVAYRLACEGTALLWRGDFQNARQLLQALARRLDRPPRKAPPHRQRPTKPSTGTGRRRRAGAGARHGGDRGRRRLRHRAAPGARLRARLREAWGPPDGQPCVVALRECLGPGGRA
jgi:hypothetical protein